MVSSVTQEVERMSLERSFDRVFPVEILAYVFKVGAGGSDHKSFLIGVSHVSHYWRDVALYTPILWWDVFIPLTITIPRSTATAFERGRAWLDRSKSLPARITIDISRPRWGNVAMHLDEIGALLDILRGHMAHCRALMINRASLEETYAIVSVLNQSDTKHLRDLYIKSRRTWMEDDRNAVSIKDISSLERIRLEDAPSGCLYAVANLTSLHYLPHEHKGSSPFSVARLWELFRCSPNLVDLDMDVEARPGEMEAPLLDQTFTLESMHRMSIKFASLDTLTFVLSRISFPHVEFLSLYSHHGSNVPQTNSLPLEIRGGLASLTVMEVQALPASILSSLLAVSPRLRDLTCAGYYTNIPILLPSIIDLLISLRSQSSDSFLATPHRSLTHFSFVRCVTLTLEELCRLGEAYTEPSTDPHNDGATANIPFTSLRTTTYYDHNSSNSDLKARFTSVEVHNASPRVPRLPFDFMVAPSWEYWA